MDDLKKTFERLAKGGPLDLTKGSDGEYVDAATHARWIGFRNRQVALSAAASRLGFV